MRLPVPGLFAALLLLFGCEAIERRHALRALPPALQAEAVDFGRDDTYGVGPGGAETGFNVIRPGAEGAGLATEGRVAWRNAHPRGRIGPDRTETPLPPDDQRALDAALNAKGSHHAFGPGGLVVVLVPANRRANVLHAS